MLSRAKAAKKPMRRKSAANGERELNTLLIEVAAAEKEKRRSNSNRGSVDAEIAAAVERPAREQLHAAFQRTREEMNAVALAKKKQKLVKIKRKQQPRATAKR